MFDGLFGVMFVLVLAIVFGIILFTIIQEVSTWNKITGRRALTLKQPLFQSGDRLELQFQGTRFLGFERR